MGNTADGGFKDNSTAACIAMHACAHTVSHTRDTTYHSLNMIVHVVKFKVACWSEQKASRREITETCDQRFQQKHSQEAVDTLDAEGKKTSKSILCESSSQHRLKFKMQMCTHQLLIQNIATQLIKIKESTDQSSSV